MPRVNEERFGPGTGTWDRECESVLGDHEPGEERTNCNTGIGTGSGTEGTREETWTSSSALAAFPLEEGWIHEDQGPCECCNGIPIPCCPLAGTGPVALLPRTLCLTISGCSHAATNTTFILEWDEVFLAWVALVDSEIYCVGRWEFACLFDIDATKRFQLLGAGGDFDLAWTEIPAEDCEPFLWTRTNVMHENSCCPNDSVTAIIQPCAGTGTFIPPGAKWWCVKQGNIGNRRICTQGVTEAYDGPYDSEAECNADCVEPDTWCVEWQDEDGEGNPVGRPYVTCEGLGTGDELGQIIDEGTRTGIVIAGPWLEDNCNLACPPCSGDYAS